MANIAVFASGNGSNFDRISADFSVNSDNKVKLLITDNAQAKCVEIAAKYGIPVFSVDYKVMGKVEAERLILIELYNNSIDIIALAGYMRILSAPFVINAGVPIINIHPSLLPAFKGTNSIRRAYQSSEQVTGITIHFVNEEVDDGEIIFQKSLIIKRDESVEFLEKEIHSLEHDNYSNVIKELCGVINKKKEGAQHG